MKTRFVPLVGLAISFALPTYAQQKEVADPQTTQNIAAILKAAGTMDARVLQILDPWLQRSGIASRTSSRRR